MIDRRHFLKALAGTAFLAIRGITQTFPPSTRRWSAVQKLLDEYVGTRKIAGAVAALSYRGVPSANPGAGHIALDSPVPFDEHSLCRIYSMTKPVTGVGAMMLVEDGKLGLDQPVRDVISEWRALRVGIDPNKGLESRPATRTMTMRHLLTHTSGLGYWTPESGADALSSAYRERGITPGNFGTRLNRPGYGAQAKGLVDMINRVAELPLAAEPGTVWRYSIGLDVMGLVVERITGKSLDVFLRERLFRPLQMDSTGFQVAAAHAARLTTNYDVTPEGLRPTDARESSAWLQPPTLIAGGAGLVSTAQDFARFGAMLLGDGALDDVRVLRPETARLTRSNLLPIGVTFEGSGFGAGMRVALAGKGGRDGPGTLFWAGAAGTVWVVDPVRGGNMVFMTQYMPANAYPLMSDVLRAVEADLA